MDGFYSMFTPAALVKLNESQNTTFSNESGKVVGVLKGWRTIREFERMNKSIYIISCIKLLNSEVNNQINLDWEINPLYITVRKGLIVSGFTYLWRRISVF